jgi:hypothetical protein
VCLVLELTGLNQFVETSYGTQQQVNGRVEEAVVAYRQEESQRLAHATPARDITLTQDETFTSGLSLVGVETMSNYILLEQAALARAHDTWQECVEPALESLNCKVIQSTSAEAPGLPAYVAQSLRSFAPSSPRRAYSVSAPRTRCSWPVPVAIVARW